MRTMELGMHALPMPRRETSSVCPTPLDMQLTRLAEWGKFPHFRLWMDIMGDVVIHSRVLIRIQLASHTISHPFVTSISNVENGMFLTNPDDLS